jgi:hypothetical protein
MHNILAAVALSYLAGSGTVTNTAVVGRGLFRAARRAVGGDLREAGVEALGALVAPAAMSFGAVASLVLDAVDAARELAGPALRAAGAHGYPDAA